MLVLNQAFVDSYKCRTSLFHTRTFNAQCGLRASLKALYCNSMAAPHTLAIGPLLNPGQRALHGSDLTRDERRLPSERHIILHLDHLLRGIRIERLGQVLGNLALSFYEVPKLHL